MTTYLTLDELLDKAGVCFKVLKFVSESDLEDALQELASESGVEAGEVQMAKWVGEFHHTVKEQAKKTPTTSPYRSPISGDLPVEGICLRRGSDAAVM